MDKYFGGMKVNEHNHVKYFDYYKQLCKYLNSISYKIQIKL